MEHWLNANIVFLIFDSLCLSKFDYTCPSQLSGRREKSKKVKPLLAGNFDVPERN